MSSDWAGASFRLIDFPGGREGSPGKPQFDSRLFLA
jgi:hypothetical protein